MIFKLHKIQRVTAIYFISLFFLYRFTDFPVLFYIIATIVYIIIPAYGALNIRSNFYVDAINTIQNKKNVVLTFNLSNTDIDVLRLLELMDELEIKGMFFITGQFAKGSPDTIKTIQQKGHIIGSHSFDLSKGFGFYTSSKLIIKLKESDRLISNSTEVPIRYFRPPFGVTNPFVQKAVKALNYEVIGWRIKFNFKESKNKILNEKKLKKVRGGEIISIDLTESSSIDLIREVIQGIKQQNVNFSLLD